jgi:hypothetical protein
MIRMALAREIGDEGHDAQLASIAAACSPYEFNLVVQSLCLQIDGHLGLLRAKDVGPERPLLGWADLAPLE